jgi:hypothetical protein
MPKLSGEWGAPPGNPVTTPFPCFLSTERVCSEAEQGLPCETGRISQGREKPEEGHGSAVPLLTNGACTRAPKGTRTSKALFTLFA